MSRPTVPRSSSVRMGLGGPLPRSSRGLPWARRPAAVTASRGARSPTAAAVLLVNGPRSARVGGDPDLLGAALEFGLKAGEFLAAGHPLLELLGGDLVMRDRAGVAAAFEHGEAVPDQVSVVDAVGDEDHADARRP